MAFGADGTAPSRQSWELLGWRAEAGLASSSRTGDQAQDVQLALLQPSAVILGMSLLVLSLSVGCKFWKVGLFPRMYLDSG